MTETENAQAVLDELDQAITDAIRKIEESVTIRVKIEIPFNGGMLQWRKAHSKWCFTVEREGNYQSLLSEPRMVRVASIEHIELLLASAATQLREMIPARDAALVRADAILRSLVKK